MRQLIAAALIAVASAASGTTITTPNYDFDWSTTFAQTALAQTPESVDATWKSTLGSGSFVVETDYHNSGRPLFGAGVRFDLTINQPVDTQLRFSYWHLQYQFEVFDVTANQVIESKTADIFGTGSRQITFDLFDEYTLPNAAQLKFTGTYTFAGGNVLTPSMDPSCQAFSCMQLKSDDIAASLRVSLAPVPEASTVSMLVLGVVATTFVARRRRAV